VAFFSDPFFLEAYPPARDTCRPSPSATVSDTFALEFFEVDLFSSQCVVKGGTLLPPPNCLKFIEMYCFYSVFRAWGVIVHIRLPPSSMPLPFFLFEAPFFSGPTGFWYGHLCTDWLKRFFLDVLLSSVPPVSLRYSFGRRRWPLENPWFFPPRFLFPGGTSLGPDPHPSFLPLGDP